MVAVDYIEVLQGTADLCGLDRDNIGTVEATILRNLLSKRLGTAWQNQNWPDFMRLEKRYFRALYDPAASYAQTNEVYWPQTQAYYQALVATTGNPPTDGNRVVDYTRWALSQTSYTLPNYSATAAYVAGGQVYDPATDNNYQAIAPGTGNAPGNNAFWRSLVALDQYISKDQAGKTPLGTVFNVKDRNRRMDASAVELCWFTSENGIQVTSVVVWAWVDFRLRAPVLTGGVFSATATYAIGGQAYYKSAALAGNFYNALAATAAGESPETTPAKWAVVSIPAAFKSYLEHGAASDYLMPEGEDEAAPHRGMAEEMLGNQAAVLLGQEGQALVTTPLVGTR